MHRFAKNDLKQLEFRCKNEKKCKEVLIYNDALIHINNCKFIQYQCRFKGCSSEFYGSEREIHE